MKLRTATLAAVLLAASIPSLSTTADARPFGFHGGGWGHSGGWGGAGFGLAAGALVGAALAAPYYGAGYGYGYGYPYGYGGYGYDDDYGYAPAYSYGYAPVVSYGYGYAPRPVYRRHVGYRTYGYRAGYGAYAMSRVGYSGSRSGVVRAGYGGTIRGAHIRHR